MEKKVNRIAQLREQNNITQATLARHLGVAVSCLCMWENGQRKPNIEYLKKIAEFFNVSIDYLTGFSPLDRQELTEEERELIELVKELNEEQTKTLSEFVDFLISKRK